MVQGSPRISTPGVSDHLNVPRKKVSIKLLHTERLCPYHIQRIQRLEPTDMVRGLASCSVSIANPQSFVTFCLAAKFILHTIKSTKPESAIC